MKVGDKYICIQSRDDLNLEGNIYTILNIDADIAISVEKSIYHISAHYSYLEIDSINYYIFDDHFISVKEQRKLKLEKLNENR